ncbi:MAG TPA: translation initiation factor IF-3, partial [Opitutaceae bacterium]
FRGREMAHTELGFDVMKRAVADLVTMGHADSEPKLIGRNIHVMITPLPPNKRKPKFHERAEDHEPEDAEEHGGGRPAAGSNPPQAGA